MLTLVAALAIFAQEQGPLQEMEEVRRDIELLRTINALNLTRDQMERVVKLVEEAKKKQETVAADAKEDLAALVEALKKLRGALEKGEKIDPEQEREVGELQRAVGEVMRGFGEVQEKLIGDLKQVFDEKQWKAIQAMGRPDPIRGLRENLGRMVERLRENPDADPTEPIREQLKRMARPLGLNEKDVDAEVERIVKLLNEAADAEDPEPFLKKIVEEGKLGEAAKRMQPPQEEGGRRFAQIFMEPRLLRVLKKRLENMK